MAGDCARCLELAERARAKRDEAEAHIERAPRGDAEHRRATAEACGMLQAALTGIAWELDRHARGHGRENET